MPGEAWAVVAIIWIVLVALALRVRASTRPGTRRVGVDRSRFLHPDFWRTGGDPPTPQQVAFLRVHHAAVPATKAEASKLISRIKGEG